MKVQRSDSISLVCGRADEGLTSRLTLDDLPPELVRSIADKLDTKSLFRLEQTSRCMAQTLQDAHVWHDKFQRSLTGHAGLEPPAYERRLSNG